MTTENRTRTTYTHQHDMKKSNLINISKDFAVSPRVYRLMQLIARTSWGNDLDWYIKDMQAMLLNEGKNLLHEYTYCVNHGITREEYYKQERLTMWELY